MMHTIRRQFANPAPVIVDRCVCAGQTFEGMLEQAAAGCAPQEMARACGMGAGCRMCEPYVRRSCRTGQVVFGELLDDDDEPA